MITTSELIAVLVGTSLTQAKEMRAQVFLQLLLNGDLATANTWANEPPVGYYVIVGRGVSAWYNHLTLLKTAWGRLRLSDGGRALPVMHVGFQEPWSRRKVERMGQWGRMLNYFAGLGPGLGLAQNIVDDPNWLTSRDFAASIAAAQVYANKYYRVHQIDQGEVIRWPPARLRTDNRVGPFLRLKNGLVGLIETRADFNAHRADEGYLPPPKSV